MTAPSPFTLSGKRALIVGVANDQSIAWGVARAMAGAGARIAMTYLNAKAEPHVRPLARSIGAGLCEPLDVEEPEQMDGLIAAIENRWAGLDILVHSIAYAPLDDLHGRVTDTSNTGFQRAMDISVHSFIRLTRRTEALMPESGGTCLTMSYYGAEKVVDNYNVMGPVKAALEATVRELAAELGPRSIRVNALSPGPIATRAASGIAEFSSLLETAQKRAPLRRLADIDDVGQAATFLASDAARAITGVTLHVDAGQHVLG
jgi:enoyl-[acyl-carrier protein] reductase I